jgi:hypothetical protein
VKLKKPALTRFTQTIIDHLPDLRC